MQEETFGPIIPVMPYDSVDEAVTSYDEKLQMSESYKKHLATIPCTKFNFGDGECPFGSSCFYDHRYRDGTPWDPPKPQFVL